MLAPHVLLGFPPLVVAGGPTARLGGLTAPETEAGSQTVPETEASGQTVLDTEAGGPTVSPGGQTTHRTKVGGSTTTPGSPTSRPYAPRGAHDSSRTSDGSGILALLAALLTSPSCCAVATGKASNQQSPPAKAVPVTPVTPGFKAKPDAHRMYAQDQVVIHTVRM
jgi:hypothetical protein